MFNFAIVLLLLKRFATFGGGSIIGALLDYGITLLAHQAFALAPSQALAFAMAISASVVFLYHEKITFRISASGWPRRYARFLLLAVLVLALRVAIVEALAATGLSVPLVVAIAIVAVSVVNFAASSTFVFLKGQK